MLVAGQDRRGRCATGMAAADQPAAADLMPRFVGVMLRARLGSSVEFEMPRDCDAPMCRCDATAAAASADVLLRPWLASSAAWLGPMLVMPALSSKLDVRDRPRKAAMMVAQIQVPSFGCDVCNSVVKADGGASGSKCVVSASTTLAPHNALTHLHHQINICN